MCGCEGDDGGSTWHKREDGAGCGVVGVEVGVIDVWLMHGGQRDGSWHYRGGLPDVVAASRAEGCVWWMIETVRGTRVRMQGVVWLERRLA